MTNFYSRVDNLWLLLKKFIGNKGGGGEYSKYSTVFLIMIYYSKILLH